MKVISETALEKGHWPEGWFEEWRNGRFVAGGFENGRGCVLHVPLPDQSENSETLIFEVEIEAEAGAKLTCSDGVATILVDGERGQHLINYAGIAPLVMVRGKLFAAGKTFVSFVFERGRLTGRVNGEDVVTSMDAEFAPSRSFTLSITGKSRIIKISVLGDESEPSVAKRDRPIPKDFEFEMAVDFYDDLVHSPWTAEMLDELFVRFRQWGVGRCHWFDYGKRAEGWWDHAPHAVGRHAKETMDKVGEIFPAAVTTAHRQGIEIFGLLKPFDMGLFQDAIPSVEGGRLERIGGALNWIAKFPAQRRDLIMARKPGLAGPGSSQIFTRIDLVKDDAAAAAFGRDDVQLFVSADNLTFQLYTGPGKCEEVVEDYPVWESSASGGRPNGKVRLSRVLRWSGLAIPERFVALRVGSGAGSFSNTLVNLIHVFGDNGEERRLTYGFSARAGEFELADNVSAKAVDPDFRKYGFHFDVAPGTPTSLFPGYDAMEASFIFDGGEGLLAFASGKNDGPLAALSPSFPEVREWWLSWAKFCLESGADGIELRDRNHHSHLTWREYGFEAPVRDEFLRRHGVDLWATDDFDRVAWSRLRGEGYTQFVREVRALTRAYGKSLGIHLSLSNLVGPNEGSSMEIHWDWERWLDEGLVDSITLKDVLPGSRFAMQVMERAGIRGVRVNHSPYANNLWGQPGGEKVCRDWIALAKRSGMDGYQFYECAGVINGAKEGTVVVTQPAIEQVFQDEFGGGDVSGVSPSSH